MRSFLTFEVAGHDFAFEMADLAEVIPCSTINRIPKAPDHVRGLIPRKGDLMPVLDLRVCLDITDDHRPLEKHIIIIRKNDAFHGIIADQVREILQVAEQNLVKPEDFSLGIDLSAIEKVIQIENSDRVPMVLNLEKLIS